MYGRIDEFNTLYVDVGPHLLPSAAEAKMVELKAATCANRINASLSPVVIGL